MNKNGYRGYIGSRPYRGEHTPQHVQNLVIRDYCQRNGLHYLLSAAEYAMPGCYIILEEILNDLSNLNGIVMYSIFMLPQARQRREQLYEKLLSCGTSLHGALENLMIMQDEDIGKIEDLLLVQQALSPQIDSIHSNTKLLNAHA